MTNYEKNKKWFDENQRSIVLGLAFCVKKNGELAFCHCTECKDCMFVTGVGHCAVKKREWMDAETDAVDWSNVAVDTPILVSEDGKAWKRRHFAKVIGGAVYAFDRGLTSWTNDTLGYGNISKWEYAKLAEDSDN